MEERPKRPQKLDVAAFAELGQYEFRSAEKPEERASRLKQEEAEAGHTHRIELLVDVVALAILTIAFVAGICIADFGDPKTGLPDKAIAMVAGIVVALASYVAGSRSKCQGGSRPFPERDDGAQPTRQARCKFAQ